MKWKTAIVSILLLGLLGWGIYDAIPKKSKEQNAASTEAVGGRTESESQNGASNPDSASAKVGLEIGNLAPEFDLKTLQGESGKLSDYRGKKVIINFWASWCPPCRAEMPEMVEFYKEYKNKNVEILGVNLTQADKVSDAKEFVKEFQVEFPILLDERLEAGNAYMVQTIPVSYILDSDGIIRKKYIGPMTHDWMVEQIESIN